MHTFDGEEIDVVNGAWQRTDGRFYELPERPIDEPDDEHRQELIRIVTRLLPRAANGHPAIALQAVRALRRRVDHLEREAVLLAKECRWSWRDIGDALGLSRSQAQRRHRTERHST